MRSVVEKVVGGRMAGMLAIGLVLILAVAILVPMRTASASNVISGASGPASVEFVSASADFVNTVSVTAPVNRVLFDTEDSRIGTRAGLGTFSSGTTFQFQLQARTSGGSFTWSSDPAQNSDARQPRLQARMGGRQRPGRQGLQRRGGHTPDRGRLRRRRTLRGLGALRHRRQC
jgi:hypothetical protein